VLVLGLWWNEEEPIQEQWMEKIDDRKITNGLKIF
jgi:hypothetical protein